MEELTKSKNENTRVDNPFGEFDKIMGTTSLGLDATMTAGSYYHAVETLNDMLSVAGPKRYENLNYSAATPQSFDIPNGSRNDGENNTCWSQAFPPMQEQQQWYPPSYQNWTNPTPYRQTMNVPPYQQTMDLPPYQQTIDVPQYQQTMGVPPYQQTMGVPPYQQTMGVPPYPLMQYQLQPSEMVTPNVPFTGSSPAHTGFTAMSVSHPATAATTQPFQRGPQDDPYNEAPLQDTGSYQTDMRSLLPSFDSDDHELRTTDSNALTPTQCLEMIPEFTYDSTLGPDPQKPRKKLPKRKHIGGGCGGLGDVSGDCRYCAEGGDSMDSSGRIYCRVCHREFLNKSSLRPHMRTHTGEKPFQCTMCDKTFRQKVHVRKHEKTHRRVDKKKRDQDHPPDQSSDSEILNESASR